MLINFLSALALVFVIEGLMPFAAPGRWKRLLLQIIARDDTVLRVSGFISMLMGVILLTIIRQFAE